MIGKFEELTLLALVKAGPRAHAAKVYDMFVKTQPKAPAFAALYTAIDRMARKGMVSEDKDEMDLRGKRLFTITAEGQRALREALSATYSLGGFDIGGLQNA